LATGIAGGRDTGKTRRCAAGCATLTGTIGKHDAKLGA